MNDLINPTFSKIDILIIVLVIIWGFLLRSLPFIKFKYLFSIDSVGHLWFSKIILDSGKLAFSYNDLNISYRGETGWYTGYVTWPALHIVEAVISILTGISIESFFLLSFSVLSTYSTVLIYLAFRNQSNNKYQLLGLIVVSSLWFYFIFQHGWSGTYKVLGYVLYLLTIYLTSSNLEKTTKSGKLLVALILTTLAISHNVSQFATLIYLSALYIFTRRFTILVYTIYMIATILITSKAWDFAGFPYGGLNFLGPKLILLSLLPVPLVFLSHVWNKLEQDIKEFLLLLTNRINTKTFFWVWVFALSFLLFFSENFQFIHYIFNPEYKYLLFEYVIFLSPLIFIIAYIISKEFLGVYDHLLYIFILFISFLVVSILSDKAYLFLRHLEYSSVFIIMMLSRYSKDYKKLLILLIVVSLALIPAIPSYYYSEGFDRPNPVISSAYYETISTFPTKCNAGEDLHLKTTGDPSEVTVINTLLKIYGKYSSKNLCKILDKKFDIYHNTNRIYQADFSGIRCYEHSHPGVVKSFH